MQFFVYSRSALEAIRPHEEPHAILSITSSPDDVARLPTNDACRGVLRLAFLDVESPSTHVAEGGLFSPEHARQIWAFADQHRPHVGRLLIHCDAGVSRSAAVAAALARVFNGDDAEFFQGRYRPNELVYRTLLECRGARPGGAF